MRLTSIYLLLLLATIFCSCSEGIHRTGISGKISAVTDSVITIGQQTVPVDKDGSFEYTDPVERPVLLDLSYNKHTWTLFLKPACSVEITIPDNTIEHITYTGDLKTTNTYLIEINSVNQDINQFFTSNWANLHQLNQNDFIAAVDSVKELYNQHLVTDKQRYQSLDKDFIDLWNAEVNFSLNRLILAYPERHLQFTGKRVALNSQLMAYANTSDVDNPEYFDLPGYKKFTEASINLESQKILENDATKRNYNLKKIDAAFKVIRKKFQSEYLRDYWLSSYLKEFIGANGISNSEKQLRQFNSICNTAYFKKEMEQFVKSIKANRNDHEVYVYKTAEGYNLEVHLFRPNTINKKTKRAAIAIFHGGGWSSGNVEWAFGRAKYFAGQGMVGIAVQYRISNLRDITPVEAMDDTRDAILWIRSHADSLGIIADKIAGEGWSAGGHLITSAAFFPETTSDGKINSIPNALILKSPALQADSWCVHLLGNRAIAPETISPLDNIKMGMDLPPVLILQGRADHVTPVENAQLFYKRMKAENYRCKLVIYEDCGHLFTPSYLDDTGWPQPDKVIAEKADREADVFLRNLGFIE